MWDRAIRISRRLHGHEPAEKLAAPFENLPTAVFLLGPGGHVHYANRAAEQLRQEDDLLIYDRVGRLTFKDPTADKALSRALFHIANHEHDRLVGDFTAGDADDGSSMNVTVAPLRKDGGRRGRTSSTTWNTPGRLPSPRYTRRQAGVRRARPIWHSSMD